MEVIAPRICNCSRSRAGSGAACSFCRGPPPPPPPPPQPPSLPLLELLYTWPLELLIKVFEGNWSFAHGLRLVGATIVGVLVGFFTLGGAFMGAVAGALASRASEHGVVHGALLGAIAGAILSLEILEASRAYWNLEQSGVRGPSSMADFIEELLQERFLEDEYEPAVLTAYFWQVNISYRRYEEIRAGIEESECRGLSRHSLKKLPCHQILEEIEPAQSICCSICLQNIEAGDTVRCLPRCHHMFHMTCVDTWLMKCGSCPVCRRIVKCT